MINGPGPCGPLAGRRRGKKLVDDDNYAFAEAKFGQGFEAQERKRDIAYPRDDSFGLDEDSAPSCLSRVSREQEGCVRVRE